jgi:hypothetical protein
MHVPRVHAESPQRHRTQFVGRILRRILDDAVAGFNVVEQEVAVRMNDLIPQGLWYGECSAVDDSSCRCGDNGADMAGRAADPLEQALAFLGGRSCGKNRVARRNLRAADELSEVVDVGQAEIIRSILRIRRDFADRCHIFGTQTVCHSHFIQIGVADEGEQAAVLILPAKTADTRLSGRFQNRNFDGFTMNSAFADFDLALRDRLQGAIVDGLDKSIS